MGWGGSALAANQIIKNNRAMLKKRTKNKLSFASENKNWVDHKTASPELLAEIRERVIREQSKRRRRRVLVTTLVITAIIIGGLIYVMNN